MLKPKECLVCPLGEQRANKEGDLYTIGQSFSQCEGEAKHGVAFLLEALGKHEAQEGLPARPNGESGSLLTSIVKRNLRMEREDFLWDNVVKCRPPENVLDGAWYEEDAIQACRVHNGRSIGSHNFMRLPNRTIVAMGGVAFRSLTGVRGKKRGIEDVRGYVFESEYGHVVPTLHPAFIRRGNARFTGALIRDIKKALRVASGVCTSYSSHAGFNAPEFVRTGKLNALVSLYYQLRDNPRLTYYYDIETPWSKEYEEDEKDEGEDEWLSGAVETQEGKVIDAQLLESENPIRSIQFAIGKDWAITVPWERPFIKVALAILALGNDRVGSNCWIFDDKKLAANGAKFGGRGHDLMWAWHHLQPGLWKGLQRIGSFFDAPMIWKHMAQESDKEDEYGGWDVIVPCYIWERLPTMMRQMGVWDSYMKFKVRYREILAETETRGLPVDEGERQELKGWLEGQIAKEDQVLQAGVPMELRNVTPRRKDKATGEISYGYKSEPNTVRQLRAGYELTRDKLITERGILPERILPFEKWASAKTGLVYRDFSELETGDREDSTSARRRAEVARWCKVQPFKASANQLLAYIRWQVKRDPKGPYYVPVTLKERKPTTAKKELIELYEATQDPVLESTIKSRSLAKMLGNDIKNWTPDVDGCVHTTFKFDPPSLQLNSSGPNIQNARKHEPDPIAKMLGLGSRFRKLVKAPKGRCVVEFDKSAFHVVIMGYEARDPLYIKWAKVDMHTLITSYIVNDPIPLEGEPDLAKIAYIKKKFKVIRDTQGKPTVLGNQLGLGEHKLWYTNKTYIDKDGKRQVGIESRKRAKWLQDLIAEMFSKVHKYKQAIKEQAHYQSYLKSSYGVLRWFFDVLRWNYGKRRMDNGTEAEEAISHNIQSDAFGHIHSEIIDMADTSEILQEHWFANTIHDSVIFFPEIGKLDRCLEEVSGYMLKPDKVLVDPVCCPEGLVVGVDAMVSPEEGNWAGYDKDRNPMGMQEVKLGSGTTGVACKRLGRSFIGIEQEREYCEIALERIKAG